MVVRVMQSSQIGQSADFLLREPQGHYQRSLNVVSDCSYRVRRSRENLLATGEDSWTRHRRQGQCA